MKLRTAVAVCLLSAAAAAQTQPLTLQDALELARRRAPAILIAKDRIAEARGRLKGASVLFQQNPQLDLAAGPRRSATNPTTDDDFGVSQGFELGGRRGARIAGARADVDRETAASENTARQLLRDVSVAFWQTVAASDRMQLAKAQAEIANKLFESMDRRFQLGDVTVLELNVSRHAAARARSELRSAEADFARASGDFRTLVGMQPGEQFTLTGDLRQHTKYDLDALVASALDRPDVRALQAEIRQAQAEIRLGKGFAWPDAALGYRHERDEGDTIQKATLSFTIPIFSNGQEQRAVGEARKSRLTRELESTKRAVAIEVRTAFEVYEREVAAADDLFRDAVQSLSDNEQLARRSFEEGEISLVELLTIRRDTYEIRTVHLDHLLDAAIAGVELESRAGLLK